MSTARAFWIEAPGQGCLREALLPLPEVDEVLVETLHSGVSRGTERLVFEGKVPESEYERMRCPHQEGDFPGPVKYGYAAVGRVIGGEKHLLGRTVFCLHPHQDRFIVPAQAAAPLPDGVPPERAVLGANMETALNIVWDAGVLPGDRVAVVGAGVVGLLTAYIFARIAGVSATVIDTDPAKELIANALSCGFRAASEAMEGDCDVVVHASGHADGLGTALSLAGFEARLVEASWYGEAPVAAALGGAFHSRRLSIVSSQVGHVAPARRARRTRRQRLEQALKLLADPLLDGLVTGETDFADLPGDYGRILTDAGTLCHRIRYP